MLFFFGTNIPAIAGRTAAPRQRDPVKVRKQEVARQVEIIALTASAPDPDCIEARIRRIPDQAFQQDQRSGKTFRTELLWNTTRSLSLGMEMT